MNNKHEEMKREAIEDIMERLKDYNGYYCDLRNEVFNTDYYIIGTYLAEKKLEAYGVFEAIRLVQRYEMDQFGKVYTDLSDPEKLIDMVYYIIGGEIICEMAVAIPEFDENWANVADDKTNEKIVKRMKELYNYMGF